MSDKPKSLKDIDSFWELRPILPEKRPAKVPPRQVNTDTVELCFGDDTKTGSGSAIPKESETISYRGSARNEARRLNELPMSERAREYRSKPLDPYLIYEDYSRLIKRVEVSKWDTRFNFYESFERDLKRLWDRTAHEAEYASFFSYVPQYSQLKYAQLKWYLYWRENIRHGVYLRADFCYILLYIYEILNAPEELLSPEAGLDILCDVWLNYRETHKRLDQYLAEWVLDFCLVNKLPCPVKKLDSIMSEIVAVSAFREFYMDSGHSGAAVLAYSSMYDWHKSRYLTAENRSLFKAHINGAFEAVYREVLSKKDTGLARELRIERTAYEGALCVYSMKRTIVIEYLSYSRSPAFKFTVTDIIKYSENRIRMAIGVKSRLKTESLTDEQRLCIDRYFDAHLPAPRRVRSKNGVHEEVSREYEKLYEPVSTSLSVENARKIEAASWATTDKLISAFEEDFEETSSPAAPVGEGLVSSRQSLAAPPVGEGLVSSRQSLAAAPVGEGLVSSRQNPPATPVGNVCERPCAEEADEFEIFAASLDEISKAALRRMLSGESYGFEACAKENGILPDALADKINEAAFDIIGDSVIELDGTYTIISEYKGDIEKWLK